MHISVLCNIRTKHPAPPGILPHETQRRKKTVEPKRICRNNGGQLLRLDLTINYHLFSSHTVCLVPGILRQGVALLRQASFKSDWQR